MNHHQLEKNGMYQKLSIFFAKSQNSAIWQTFTRLVSEIAKFLDLMEMFASYTMQQSSPTRGITDARENAFLAMVALVVNKAQKAYVWAYDTKNAALMELFDVQKTDFTEGPRADALTKTKLIFDAINANIDDMETIQLSAADVTALNTVIASYEKTQGTTGAAQSYKKGGTDGMVDIIHQIDETIDLIDKLLPNQYGESHPDMVNEYWNNRAIDRIATRHSGIVVHIADSKTGNDLEGAILQLNGKSATSDIYGIAEIIKIKSGTFNATVDYNETIITLEKVVIQRGKITKLEVKVG
jgi:hypothetical protein